MMSDKTHEFHAVEQQEIDLIKAKIEAKIEERKRFDEKIREQLETCQKCGSKNIEFVGFAKVCNDCGEGVYDLIEQPKFYDELDRIFGIGTQIPERMLK